MWQYVVAKAVQTSAKIYDQINTDEMKRASSVYQSGVLENNAVMADWDAYNAIKTGQYNINRFKENFSKMQGSARVAAASGGVVVNEGSALDVLTSNAGEAAKQEVIMRYEAETAAYKSYLEAVNYRQQAALVRASAPSTFSTAVGVLGQVAGAVAQGYGAAGGAGGAGGGAGG